jgi:hypothetical protein
MFYFIYKSNYFPSLLPYLFSLCFNLSKFTRNLSFMEIFDKLVNFCKGKLVLLGASLDRYYQESRDVQSLANLRTIMHPDFSTLNNKKKRKEKEKKKKKKKEEEKGKEDAMVLRQDHPLVGLSATVFNNKEDLNGESKYIHLLRMVGFCVTDLFQERVQEIVVPLGGRHGAEEGRVKSDLEMRDEAKHGW